MYEFLDWIARAGGILALLIGAVAFIFREKWRQILQRSLAQDLERLKSELVKAQAVHAASLTPQLEQIKHDFQQKLEAYKVSLIAETEAVKAKGELRKTIALRYAEIEFDRLVALERVLSPLTSDVLALASINPEYKTAEHWTKIFDGILALSSTTDAAEMFIPIQERLDLTNFRGKLLAIASQHVGFNRDVFGEADSRRNEVIDISATLHTQLKDRIRALGNL